MCQRVLISAEFLFAFVMLCFQTGFAMLGANLFGYCELIRFFYGVWYFSKGLPRPPGYNMKHESLRDALVGSRLEGFQWMILP